MDLMMEEVCVNKMDRTGFFHIIFWIILGIVIVAGLFLILPKSIFSLSAIFSPRVPEPEITRGEFPFRIEYELDEETHIIEDIVIAEFNGFVFSAGSMEKERQWISRLASGRTDLPFEGEVSIYFSRGNAQYYMGENVQSITFRPHIFIPEERPKGKMRHDLKEAQEILEEYGITLLSWEISEPITNKFND